MEFSKKIGETLVETLEELFVIEDMGIPLNEIRDLKTLNHHLKAAESKYGKEHNKYQTLSRLYAKKEATERRKAERIARIKARQEHHAKRYGYKREKGNRWVHKETGHSLTFGKDRSWSHMKSGGKRPKGGKATPIRDLRRHLAKLHEEVAPIGEELNEIRTLERLRQQANQALLNNDPIERDRLQRALTLQRRKHQIMRMPTEEEIPETPNPRWRKSTATPNWQPKKIKKTDKYSNTLEKVCPHCNNYDDECTCED
jgi:hypothetical protein